MQSFRDLYAGSKGAPDGPTYSNTPMLGEAELPNGTQLIVEIKTFKPKQKEGVVNFSGVSRIIEGGPGEGELWTSVNFSPKEGDGAKRFNKQAFAKLEAIGLDEAFFAADPSPEAIEAAAKGKRFRLIVQWEGKFDRHQWVAIETPSAVNTAVAGTGFRPAI